MFVQLWITKLAQQPPMYTDALAKMFVGVFPIALLMHMALACYMLGNADVLNVAFVRQVFYGGYGVHVLHPNSHCQLLLVTGICPRKKAETIQL